MNVAFPINGWSRQTMSETGNDGQITHPSTNLQIISNRR
jgi:hypothetical protein